jgi:hypothetical protein
MELDLAQTDPTAGQRESLLPWLGVLFAGLAALGIWFLIGPALAGGRYYKVGYNRTAYEYSRLIVLLFIPYGLTLFAWRRGHRSPLWLLVGGALVLHVLVLFAPLPQSQDFYQYLFYGKLQAVHGANPFIVNPSAFWADRWFPWIRWNTQASVYGPVWIMVAAGVVKLAGANLASAFVTLKLVILALDAAVVAMIVAGARGDHDRAGLGVLAWAWNPLVLITVPLAGSADTAVAAAFLGAYLTRRKGHLGATTLLLALASLVKVYAVVALVLHLVLVLKERGAFRALRHAGGALAVAILAYAPYWHGMATFKGLRTATTLTNQSLMGTFQRTVVAFALHVTGFPLWYRGSLVATRILGAVLFLAALAWGIRRVRDGDSLWLATVGVMLTYLLVSPWFLYWYILAPLTLLAVMRHERLTDPVLVFSGTSLVSIYIPVAPVLWIVQTLLRYAPPFVTLWVQGHHRRAAGSLAPAPADLEERRQRRALVDAGVAASSAIAGHAPAAK